MYSGTTFTKMSGRVMGTHQKIDRIARHNLTKMLGSDVAFPTSGKILHFEGKNGPDAIKRKSPAKDEPWHYFDPFDDKDSGLVDIIIDHYNLLVKQLKQGNKERAAFEAAWLAHAITDGLTPAHHYPYEKKLIELRGGEGIETRTSIKDKLLMPGNTKREMMKNNWKMWGPKGLLTTHSMFEAGVVTLLAPLKFVNACPSAADIENMQKTGIIQLFKHTAREVASMKMYDRFYKQGWTTKLTVEVQKDLIPTIIRTVTLAWYSALVDAGLADSDS